MLCVAALALSCIVTASAQNVVPVTKEPNHHLAVSNEYVRAFKVEVAPNSETLYHQHDNDYVYVTIGDADLTNMPLNAAPTPLKLKDGETRFAKAPLTHKVGNNLDQPFRNVTIELLKGIGTPICGLAGGEKTCPRGWDTGGGVEGAHTVAASGGYYETLLDSQNVIVKAVSLDPESAAPATLMGDGPLLIVPISKAKLKIMGNAEFGEHEPGETIWVPANSKRFIKNLSSKPIRFVIIGFKGIVVEQ